MNITKLLKQTYVYPELGTSTNVIGAVDWIVSFEENGVVSNAAVRTSFTDYKSTAPFKPIEELTDDEIIAMCVEIEGGQTFLDHLETLHTPNVKFLYQMSLMEPYIV